MLEHTPCRVCGDSWGQHYTQNNGSQGCLQQTIDATLPSGYKSCDCAGYDEVQQHYRIQIDIDHKPTSGASWLAGRIYDNTTNAPRTLSSGLNEAPEEEAQRIKQWNHFCRRIGEITGIFSEK